MRPSARCRPPGPRDRDRHDGVCRNAHRPSKVGYSTPRPDSAGQIPQVRCRKTGLKLFADDRILHPSRNPDLNRGQMIITRKKVIPLHWAFYAQLPLLLSIYGGFVLGTPFLLLMKRFLDNPAAIMGLISMEVYLTLVAAPLISWISDRIWTRYGRRKGFIALADALRGLILIAMPFSPNLIVLIGLRWLFGIVGALGQPTQALAYEVVPAPQRGVSAGFFSASIQFGNLVFFFLLLGRFDDLYFLGPLSIFTHATGGVIMFMLAAILLLGIAAYEILGFKEIKPPDAQSLNDGRKPGESLIRHFFRAFIRDVLGKDLLPLYLLLIVNTMFGVGLGIFQPLLFTEQWGYSLQDLGNTVAVGVVLAVALSLISGWVADKFGKMRAFLLANIGSFIVNVGYTLFVWFLPDQRPSLLQIVLFGNIGLIFGMLKGVVSFPLMMEYVKRNRMGAAGAGIGLFNALFNNTVVLFVGVWLAWWSSWFLPQAGYRVEAVFSKPQTRAEVESLLAPSGLQLRMEPLHPPGTRASESHRWRLHQDDAKAKQLLAERKRLTDEVGTLQARIDSPLSSPERREVLRRRLDEVNARLAEIATELEQASKSLLETLAPILKGRLSEPGSQILSASLSEGTAHLSLRTLNPVSEDSAKRLVRLLEGPEQLMEREGDGPRPRLRGRVAVSAGEDPGGSHLDVSIGIDARFLKLFEPALKSGSEPASAHLFASTVLGVMRGVLGREPDAFELAMVEISAETSGNRMFSITLESGLALGTERLELLGEALDSEEILGDVRAFPDSGRIEGTWRVEQASGIHPARKADLERLLALTGGDSVAAGLLAVSAQRITETAAAPPLYIFVPAIDARHEPADRVYEYFFSSQVLMIATDLFGFAMIWLLVVLEKRGRIRRLGAEEDLHR